MKSGEEGGGSGVCGKRAGGKISHGVVKALDMESGER